MLARLLIPQSHLQGGDSEAESRGTGLMGTYRAAIVARSRDDQVEMLPSRQICREYPFINYSSDTCRRSEQESREGSF